MPIIYINESDEIDKEKTSRSEILSGVLRGFYKFTKDYYQQYKDMSIAQRFRLSQRERDTYDAVGDSKFIPTNKNDFLNGNTDELEFKVGSKFGLLRNILSVAGAFATGILYIELRDNYGGTHGSESKISDYIKKEIKHDVSISNKNNRIVVKVKDL